MYSQLPPSECYVTDFCTKPRRSNNGSKGEWGEKRVPMDADEGLRHQIANDIGSYSALAVVSGLQGTLGLAMMRSINANDFPSQPGLRIVEPYCVLASAASILSLYSTMVFSLNRYYGHAAMAKKRLSVFVRMSDNKWARLIRKGAFWAFIGSTFLLVTDLALLSFLHLAITVDFKHVVFVVVLLAIFSVTVFFIVRSAGDIYAPRVESASDGDTDAGVLLSDEDTHNYDV